jgi:hypothetical protein
MDSQDDYTPTEYWWDGPRGLSKVGCTPALRLRLHLIVWILSIFSGAFHFGTIAEGSGQLRGDCPYRMGQWTKVKCTHIFLIFYPFSYFLPFVILWILPP